MDNLWPDAEWIPLDPASEPTDTRRLLVRTEFPNRINLGFASGDWVRILAGLREIVLEHDGWLNVYGVTCPPTGTEEFWAELSQLDLLLIIRSIGAMQTRKLAPLLAAQTATAAKPSVAGVDYDQLATAIIDGVLRRLRDKLVGQST